MDDTSSNGPLAAAQAWNEKQANAFRRGEIRSEIVQRSFEKWWESEGYLLDCQLSTHEVARLAWLTATLQCEEDARAELQDELARLTGGAK
jgi:hypothetical protein